MKITGIALLLVLKSLLFIGYGQEAVFFFAADSNCIHADLYRKDPSNPYIILCPQEGSGPDEYLDIAPRLMNLNYNCIAISMRQKGKPLDAIMDIQAAIRFLKPLSNKPVILWGSSVSASLCLITSIDNPRVKAVIALNPGEYLLPWKSIKKEASLIKIPVMIFSTTNEWPYIQDMVSAIPTSELTLFKPDHNTSIRGARAFTALNPANSEYWFGLTLFFKKMNR
jgi:pimeloyl-ACP methyl ester carboxylesterase